MNFFGKKKSDPPPPAPTAPAAKGPDGQGAIAKVRDTIETLSKREEHINRKIKNEVDNAKKFSAAKKQREALQCIKRKKLYEKQLEQIGATTITLETQLLALESMNLNAEVLGAQRAAANTMQQQTAAMGGVDAVEETMDQVEDGLNDANEIADALARNVGTPGVDADEDDLLAELEGLMTDDVADQMTKVDLGGGTQAAPKFASVPDNGGVVSMPSAPTSAMSEEEKELAELEQLQSSMGAM